MRLTVAPVEVPEDEPFRNDLLGRKKAADALTELVRSSTEPLVLCLDAPWGQGKTTFLQMWRGALRLAGVPTVAFSAWEHDFTDDPQIALIGEIESQFEAIKAADGGHEGVARENLKAAKQLGLKLVKAAFPTAVKIATAGALDLSDFTEDALASLSERVVERKLAEYEEGRQSLEKFRTALTRFAAELGYHDKEGAVPLVVLIDELDRCRPTYAIRLLERLKHLFAVPGIVYVLALDRDQLGHAVRSQYGSGIDADGYLRRFFDFEFRLPEPSHDAFCKAQTHRFGLEEFFAGRTGRETRYDRDAVEASVADLARLLDCSLRDLERAFATIALAIRATPRDHYLYPELLCTIVLMRIKNPQLYLQFGTGRVGADTVLKWLGGFPGGTGFLESHAGAVIEANLVACQTERFRGSDCVSRYAIPEMAQHVTDQQRQRSELILSLLQSFYFHRGVFGCLPRVIEKVDLVATLQA